MKQEEIPVEEHQAGKRKKTMETQSKDKPEPTITHHAHTQNATKVLSDAAVNEDSKRIDRMEQKVSSLQESNVELVTMVGEMRETQHREQTKIMRLQSELEEANRRATIANQELSKCKAEITTVQTKLASLSTREETTERFDRIEQMLTGTLGMQTSIGGLYKKSITGKRKDVGTVIEGRGTLEDDETYDGTQESMEPEYVVNTKTTLLLENEGSNNHTNSNEGTDIIRCR
jgi:chromosome segregation ATPase